ncbi:MAG: FecR family protein [Thiotrichales bacterium]
MPASKCLHDCGGLNLVLQRRILLVLVAFGLLYSALANAGEKVGTITRAEGACSARSAEQIRSLHQGDVILFQDTLSTASGAALTGQLSDQSEVTLGENASLKIDRLVFDPDSERGRLELNLLKGPMLFIGGKLDARRKAKVRIETPVATLGIRGTRLWAGQIDDAFGVLVLDGKVSVYNPWGSVELGAGDGTMIKGPNEAPGAVKTWPAEKVDRALKSVKFKLIEKI